MTSTCPSSANMKSFIIYRHKFDFVVELCTIQVLVQGRIVRQAGVAHVPLEQTDATSPQHLLNQVRLKGQGHWCGTALASLRVLEVHWEGVAEAHGDGETDAMLGAARPLAGWHVLRAVQVDGLVKVVHAVAVRLASDSELAVEFRIHVDKPPTTVRRPSSGRRARGCWLTGGRREVAGRRHRAPGHGSNRLRPGRSRLMRPGRGSSG